MSTMPQQKPGKSEQVVQTPKEFIDAVKLRLGTICFGIDLAADGQNRQADYFYGEDVDALTPGLTWNMGDDLWSWCNPPFSDIRPWVEKAAAEAKLGAKIAMLVPASVGSNWWVEHVISQAYVTYLHGRIKFVGHDNFYPKDCSLLLYAPFLQGGSCTWQWNSFKVVNESCL